MQKRKRLYARCFWILCSCFLFLGNFSVFHAENARANGVKEWELLSSFTTYFNENDGGRCERRGRIPRAEGRKI